jgi:hypothetical protein
VLAEFESVQMLIAQISLQVSLNHSLFLCESKAMQSKAKQSKAKQSKAKQSTCFALLLETGSGHLIQSHEPFIS